MALMLLQPVQEIPDLLDRQAAGPTRHNSSQMLFVRVLRQTLFFPSFMLSAAINTAELERAASDFKSWCNQQHNEAQV